MQNRSKNVRQYPMNIKTVTTACDQSLNCKPEKLLLIMVIPGASCMATYTFVILASLSEERLPSEKAYSL